LSFYCHLDAESKSPWLSRFLVVCARLQGAVPSRIAASRHIEGPVAAAHARTRVKQGYAVVLPSSILMVFMPHTSMRLLQLARWRVVLVFLGAFAGPHLPCNAASAAPSTVYIEEMTSPELRNRLAAGATTILVPIGGTEQNGPHMVLGKHNRRAQLLAGMIAERLGNAVVAPVLAYVPEGSVHPPAAHMRFTGTISLPDAAFEAVLEASARSFKQHGFHHVIFLGDHGGYQKNEEHVAEHLNREWRADPRCRVFALLDYYKATQGAYIADLKSRGYSDVEIGTHAGLADTALALALDKSLVRTDALGAAGKAEGVAGDPRRATAELGQLGVRRIVDTSVAAITALLAPRRDTTELMRQRR
jgi:creatinine amidohydrolase